MTKVREIPTPTIESCAAHGAPLSALLHASTGDAIEARIAVSQVGFQWMITVPDPTRFDSGIPVLGFLPGSTAKLDVELLHSDGVVSRPREPVIFSPAFEPTGKTDFPPVRVNRCQPGRMAPGYTFLSVRRRAIGRVQDLTPAQRRFSTEWGMLVALDNLGRVRWLKQLNHRPAGLQRLTSGNLFFHDTAFCSREIDLTGRTVNAWYAAQRPEGDEPDAVPVDVRSLHHQPHQMPNGNFLAVSGHAQYVRNWPASVTDPLNCRQDKWVVGDKVIEFTRDGEVVWSWDAFDHLDVHRIGYDALDAYWHVRGFPDHGDWTHCNGVCYDERDDSVLLSLRLQDAVIKIDRASGHIRWILADHGGWRDDLAKKLLVPEGPVRWPWHGHNPRITPDGTVIMFDNGVYQARPGTPPQPMHKTFSRAVEYEIDEEKMTVREIWSSATTQQEVAERTWAMGDVHRLYDSNTALVIHSIAMPKGRTDIGWDEQDRTVRHVSEFPSFARIIEYDRSRQSDIVFDVSIKDEDDLFQWEVFGGLRSPSLYPESSGILMSDIAGDGS